MIVNKVLKKAGEPTECVSTAFVEALIEREPIHQHSSVEATESRFRAYFEGLERYEYTVKDSEGNLKAIMVICADFDIHLGQMCLVPTMAYSLESGLLFGAYRFLYSLARAVGINWIRKSKTKDYKITVEYKNVSKC